MLKLFFLASLAALIQAQNPVFESVPPIISDNCLGCLCEASTNCNATIGCTDGGLCGPFLISQPFWSELKTEKGDIRPTLEGDNPDRPGVIRVQNGLENLEILLQFFGISLSIPLYYHAICEAHSCELWAVICRDLIRVQWARALSLDPSFIKAVTAIRSGTWADCARNIYCAAQTVRYYVEKFKQDCNLDGQIDCLDAARLHREGGYSCPNTQEHEYYRILHQCLIRPPRGNAFFNLVSSDPLRPRHPPRHRQPLVSQQPPPPPRFSASQRPSPVPSFNEPSSFTPTSSLFPSTNPFFQPTPTAVEDPPRRFQRPLQISRPIDPQLFQTNQAPTSSNNGGSNFEDFLATFCRGNERCQLNPALTELGDIDCNGDGQITCDDFARIHQLGGYGCSGPGIENKPFYAEFSVCKQALGLN
ncbi:unnamed protein product [Cyprideis torosa]|uniref:lysozyme n=1 Tax=Cyprideis torosa TaxID=163714 RepID=A0A7R8W7X3_9CRUS|nr:unnamed protein product [Cyprideis torosa]CAG0883152.1 unnamed protein product [Cyprideis torosa]